MGLTLWCFCLLVAFVECVTVYTLEAECDDVPISYKECDEAGRALGLRDVYNPVATHAVLSPSAELGRLYSRGCYFYKNRAAEQIQALYWNELDGTQAGSARGSDGLQKVCKHTAVAAEVQALVVDVDRLRHTVPSSKVSRCAHVSHIVTKTFESASAAMRAIIHNNIPWEDAVQEHSIAASRETNGDIGVVFEATLEEELDAAVFKGVAPFRSTLGGKKVLTGVQSSLGYHVILVRMADTDRQLSEDQRSLERSIDDAAIDRMYMEYGALRDETHIEDEDYEAEL